MNKTIKSKNKTITIIDTKGETVDHTTDMSKFDSKEITLHFSEELSEEQDVYLTEGLQNLTNVTIK